MWLLTIQKILQFLEQEAYKPLTFNEIVESLNMTDQVEGKLSKQRINDMEHLIE
jgi:hypothetical protein